MRKKLAILTLLLIAFSAGSVATAATGWRVFATASDQGEFSTYASANAKVLKPKGLAVRAIGPVESVSWTLSCDGETKAARAGVLIAVSVTSAKSCSIYGSAFGEAGTLRIQLLRR